MVPRPTLTPRSKSRIRVLLQLLLPRVTVDDTPHVAPDVVDMPVRVDRGELATRAVEFQYRCCLLVERLQALANSRRHVIRALVERLARDVIDASNLGRVELDVERAPRCLVDPASTDTLLDELVSDAEVTDRVDRFAVSSQEALELQIGAQAAGRRAEVTRINLPVPLLCLPQFNYTPSRPAPRCVESRPAQSPSGNLGASGSRR